MLVKVVVIFLMAMVGLAVISGRLSKARRRINRDRNKLLGRKCPECGVWNAGDARCPCGGSKGQGGRG